MKLERYRAEAKETHADLQRTRKALEAALAAGAEAIAASKRAENALEEDLKQAE
jgi:hypothetical protein